MVQHGEWVRQYLRIRRTSLRRSESIFNTVGGTVTVFTSSAKPHHSWYSERETTGGTAGTLSHID